MNWRDLVVLFYYVVLSLISIKGVMNEELDVTKFPDGFIMAAASASYQVEGAWNASGKGENIWDHITHNNPDFIKDKSNGDVACDSYNKYKEDVQLIKESGFSMYRFSISWARLWPDGLVHGAINQAGSDYYNNLIDELIKNNIEPMVTLYHWDLPQKLQEIGGWANPLIVNYFVDYARSVFSLYGTKVKWWITINEPGEIWRGYGSDSKAPGLNLHGTADYLVGHHLLLAHAKVYRMFEKEFKSSQNGKLSMAVSGGFAMPHTDQDIQHSERWNQFTFGWFLHPILSKDGDYPLVMREVIDAKSKTEGRPRSRLPYFTQQEIEQIKGSMDYVGINHYSSLYATAGPTESHEPDPSFGRDMNISVIVPSEWTRTQSWWLRPYAPGFRLQLNWIKKEYNNPDVFITEQGVSDGAKYQDDIRINYYQGYLEEMLKAIHLDKCNVIGYTAWSIMDNFEWRSGYTEQFGLHHIDFSDPNLKRTPKASVKIFKEIAKTGKLPASIESVQQ